MPSIYNETSRTERNADYGHVFVQILNAAGSAEVPRYAVVRVSAVALCNVSFDGVLAATLQAGEVCFFNSGRGLIDDSKKTVTVTTSAASYTQVGIQNENDRELAP